jgi:hypothetical protein
LWLIKGSDLNRIIGISMRRNKFSVTLRFSRVALCVG